MAQEIFQHAATQLAGVFSADVGRLAFSNGIDTTLVQNLNATYMQNVTRLYEVGTQSGGIGTASKGVSRVYYVGGRTQGTIAIGRVLGPSIIVGFYYTSFGDVCNAANNTMQFTFGTGGTLNCQGPDITYKCKWCVITQIGISVAAQDMIVNENSQLMFSGMEFAIAAQVSAAPTVPRLPI